MIRIQCKNLNLALVALTIMTLISCSSLMAAKINGRKNVMCYDGISLPTPRAGHAAGIVGGKLFVVGGNNWSADKKTKNWLSGTYVFDNNLWQNGVMLPAAIADTMYASDATGLYVCGGSDGVQKLNSTYLFKSPYILPTALAPLPLATNNGGAAILNGTLYVVCGATDNGLTNKMWRLDTKVQKEIWKECAPLPGPAREFPAVAACGNYIYVLGGVILQKEQPTMTVLQDTYRYDPVNDRWKKLSDLPCGGYAWSAAAVNDKYVLVAGRAYENSNVSNNIWLVNINNMSVRNIGKLKIQACAAPLIKVEAKIWWYIGGEPDATRNRTSQISIISLK
ncbi:MAG: Kelch repeat-containing protein [Sedimentisphaerales bacterium]